MLPLYIFFQQIYTKFTTDSTQRKVITLNVVRVKFFWSNNFLTAKAKHRFNREVKLFTSIIYGLWLFGFIIAAMVLMMPFQYSKFLFVEKLPLALKKFVRLSHSMFFFCGYFVAHSGLSYCAYGILHCYFQMVILRAYITEAIKNCGRKALEDKVADNNDQKEIQMIFKRCIRHYQKLKW